MTVEREIPLTPETREVLMDWLENSDNADTAGLRYVARRYILELEAKLSDKETGDEL